MIIGLDIDNVISDWENVCLAYFKKEDRKKRNNGIINPDAKDATKDMFDWSDAEKDAFLCEKMDEMGKKMKPLRGAKEFIGQLKQDGHTVCLLTHRKNMYWKNPETITKKWLKRYQIPYDKLVFTKTTNKSPECIENNVEIMFDDSISNCNQLIKSGIPCYVVKTMQNEVYKKGLSMAYDWEDIYKIISRNAQKKKVILDTDTFNECDDQFALAYMLKSQNKFDIEAITIAPYHHSKSGETIAEGTEKSYQEACKICRWLNFNPEGKVFKGATNYLKDGIIDNDAVNKIIEVALKNEKTYIMAIGAITNVAMAILKEPKIIERIEIVWLGGNGFGLSDNNEFNFKQDVQAVKAVFESGVRLTIIPAKGVASNLMTSIYELRHHLQGKSALCDYLCDIFCKDGYHSYRDRRVIWDISVIAYLINETWFEVSQINCPKINDNLSYQYNTSNHQITLVNYIHARLVYQDLFKKLADSNADTAQSEQPADA